MDSVQRTLLVSWETNSWRIAVVFSSGRAVVLPMMVIAGVCQAICVTSRSNWIAAVSINGEWDAMLTCKGTIFRAPAASAEVIAF